MSSERPSSSSGVGRSQSLTRRGFVALAGTTALSGCLGTLFSSVTGNEIPSSVPADLRHESLGVVADDDTIDIVTDADGTLVYFFATWCGPCEPQLENLHDVRDEYEPGTLAMRAVSPEDDEDEVADYWAEKGADWPAAIDPESDVHAEFGVSVYPTLVLLDPEGTVLWHTSGTTDAEDIIAAIDDDLE